MSDIIEELDSVLLGRTGPSWANRAKVEIETLRAQLAEAKAELERYKTVLSGLNQDAIDGGWNYRDQNTYTVNLERDLKEANESAAFFDHKAIELQHELDEAKVEIEALRKTLESLLHNLQETHAALCFTPDYIGTLRYNENKAAIAAQVKP